MTEKFLEVRASFPDLPVDMVMKISEGNGFVDNAIRAGWQEFVEPAQAEIEAAQLSVMNAAPGSIERLAAQKSLQKLQTEKRRNPEDPVAYLIHLVGDYIRGLLVDPEPVQQIQAKAQAEMEAESRRQIEARVTVLQVPKDSE